MSVICIPFNRKTWEYRGKPIFLILFQNIDYGYSLEPPRRGGSKNDTVPLRTYQCLLTVSAGADPGFLKMGM